MHKLTNVVRSYGFRARMFDVPCPADQQIGLKFDSGFLAQVLYSKRMDILTSIGFLLAMNAAGFLPQHVIHVQTIRLGTDSYCRQVRTTRIGGCHWLAPPCKSWVWMPLPYLTRNFSFRSELVPVARSRHTSKRRRLRPQGSASHGGSFEADRLSCYIARSGTKSFEKVVTANRLVRRVVYLFDTQLRRPRVHQHCNTILSGQICTLKSRVLVSEASLLRDREPREITHMEVLTSEGLHVLFRS